MIHLLVILLAHHTLADFPYYTDYNSVYAPNISQRTFDPNGPITFTLTIELSIPIPDLDTTVEIEIPLSLQVGGDTRRSLEGRSVVTLVTLIHSLQVPGAPGHSVQWAQQHPR